MIRNTTKDVIENPARGLLDAMNIPAAEAQGQQDVCNSSQLPSTIGNNTDYDKIVDEYSKHGIKVICKSKDDNLFLDVELPEGWKIKPTSHSMWNNLVDNNDRVRATFFYKAAFYDRDAFLNFNTRYSYEIVSHLPDDKRGHYKTVKVKRKIEPRDDGGKCFHGADGRYYYEDKWGRCTYFREAQYEEVEEKKWVPRFKNEYNEYNATPHYFNIKDGDEIIFSTKNNAQFYKEKYHEDNHREWWNEYEGMKSNLQTEAKEYLTQNFPEWEDTTKYFDK